MTTRRGIGRGAARLLGALVLVVVTAGCALDATVAVTVRPDGSGDVAVEVVADAAAVRVAEAGGATLEQRVRLDDLAAAGWSVSPFVRRPDGSAALTLVKPFATVERVPAILREISGPAGPLRAATARRSASFFGVTDSLVVGIDLGGATTGISQDPALVERIGAEGIDVGGLDTQLLTELRSALTVRLVVDLPGGGRRSLTVAPGERGRLAVRATDRNWIRIGLSVAAGALVVGAVVVLLVPRRRRRRRRPAGRRGPPGSGSGRGPTPVARPVVSPGGRGAPPPRSTSRRTPPGSATR